MTNLAQAFAISFLLANSAAAEDTLRGRLATTELFGVQTHEGTMAVTLHAYTAEQFEANVADLAQYKIDKAKRDLESEDYKRRAIEIRERIRTDRSREAFDEMRRLQAEATKKPRESSFVRTIRLYKKSKLGADYLALVSHDDEGVEILIPLSQIGRVVFTRDTGQSTEADIATGAGDDDVGR